MSEERPNKRELEAEMDAELLAYLKEKALAVKVRDEAAKNRAFTLLLARDDLFFTQLQGFTSRLFKANPIKVEPYKSKKKAPIEREVNLAISDTHIRAMLDPRELPHRFGPVEEQRRLARVAIETAEYKRQYREHTRLNILLLGDIIQGLLDHDPRDGAPLAEQAGAAIHLLIQLIAFEASQYPQVTVYCTPGNHGRNTARHKDRAMHQKWDAFETIVYYAVKQGVAHLPNVTVEIPYTPYFIYDALGHKIMGTHGDTVIKVGNPNGNINIKSINQQVSDFRAGLPPKDRFDVVVMGHMHVGLRMPLPCGVTLILNPALIPVDGFMLNGCGKAHVHNAQTLWETVKGHPAGDYRLLEVNADTDRDKSLDKVIRPFKAF